MTDEMSKAQGPSSRFGTDTPEQEAMRKIFFPNYPSQEQRGRFFQALGLAITVWQLVESALYQVYERAIAPFRPNACAAGFHAMQTFSLKLSVTDAAVRSCLAENPESIEEWSKLKKSLDDKHKRRNQFAHYSAFIMTNEEGENEKIRLEPQIFDARYITDRPSFRLSEISEITECFVELANKLERFEEKIPVKGESESDFGK